MEAEKSYIHIGNAGELKPPVRFLYRVLEIFPGLLSWGTIIGLFALSYFNPTFVAIFIIIFDVYWLSKSVRFSIRLLASYKEIKRRTKVNWLKELEQYIPPVYKVYTGSPIVEELYRVHGKYKIQKVKLISHISGTLIRDKILRDDDSWEKLVPVRVATLIKQWNGVKRLKMINPEG